MKKLLTLTTLILFFLFTGCEKNNVYCWECIQTTTTDIDVGYTYGELHTHYSGSIEDMRQFEKVYTYDDYHTNWITGEPVLVHLTTKCEGSISNIL